MHGGDGFGGLDLSQLNWLQDRSLLVVSAAAHLHCRRPQNTPVFLLMVEASEFSTRKCPWAVQSTVGKWVREVIWGGGKRELTSQLIGCTKWEMIFLCEQLWDEIKIHHIAATWCCIRNSQRKLIIRGPFSQRFHSHLRDGSKCRRLFTDTAPKPFKV